MRKVFKHQQSHLADAGCLSRGIHSYRDSQFEPANPHPAKTFVRMLSGRFDSIEMGISWYHHAQICAMHYAAGVMHAKQART